MPIVRVALDVPLATLFDYALAPEMRVQIGQRVVVPFGRRHLVGVVVEEAAGAGISAERIKNVERVLDDVPPLSPDVMSLLRFCSDYFLYPLGATVVAALPTRLRSAQPMARAEVQHYMLTEAGRAMGEDELPKRHVVQRKLFAALRQAPLSTGQLRALSPSAPAALASLVAAGWVASSQAADVHPSLELCEAHSLTPAQQQVVEAVAQAGAYACFLLHGVTGSGKTEIYVHLMHQVLRHGGQVLLLVPEINLTPQLESYFRSRLPEADLVSLHSGLADGVRAQNWMRAQSGQARIVLGTRLAVFTPMPRLALVIVDEEHDPSFKQQEGLRYSARDVAVFRASQAQVPIVLGSATPSLESYQNAKSGRYRLLRLTERAAAQAQLPAISCINTSNLIMHHGISERLLTAIRERLERGEQSMVFINRRGYAPVLMCNACGWMSGCPHCAGKLVLHLHDQRLRCHHCGHQSRVPPVCPSCGNADLQPVGIGTQRVEDVLEEHFPNARVLRIDRDSTRNKGTWANMRRQIQREEVDILVGTQMLAKGHDFPNLTLVGVLNPDGALYSGDFRASERLYAQLAQVAGRAGRAGKPGEVLIQTAFPDHPLFRALREHDYETWAQMLLAERQAAGFPPFVFQAMLRAEGKHEPEVYAFLQRAREAAVTLNRPVEVYGVVPSAIARRAAHSRAHLLVQSDSRKQLQQFLHAWRPLLDELPAKKLRWALDIDPLEF